MGHDTTTPGRTMARRLGWATFAFAAGALAVASVASAADQPVAGQATLSNAAPLPKLSTLPQFYEGGFSGLYPVANEPGQFWTLSDRGPNGTNFLVPGEPADRRPFGSPGFAPSIYKVAVDTGTGSITVLERIPLHLPAGAVDPLRSNPYVGGDPAQITGFGNTGANPAGNIPTSDELPTTDTDGDGSITADTGDAVLPFDPYGLDPEGVVIDSRDGTFWLVDEYRPSIIHVAADGELLQRYTPDGQDIAAIPGHTAVPLLDVLPARYADRRANRGFEGVAISPDGTTLYAIVQNSLTTACSWTDSISGQPFIPNTPNSQLNKRSAVRIAKVDITNPANPTVVGDFLYTMDVDPGTGDLLNANLRISDLYWVGPDQLLVDERDDSLNGTLKHLYRADLSSATNLLTQSAATVSCIDALRPAGVSGRGVSAATKVSVLNLGVNTQSPIYPFDKLEGVVQRDNGNFATVNDNDFNVENVLDPTGSPNAKITTYIEYGSSAPAPVVPEVPVVVLLPLTAAATGGLVLWFSRRRRNPSATTA